MYSMIVAVSENNAIGVDNDLPWKLSSDLKKFKELTMGHSLIMGRKTFDSIGKPLPGRKSLVLTRNRKEGDGENLFYYTSFEDIEKHLNDTNETEAFIIGGGQIYREFLPKADRIYLTRVHTEVNGDTFFPEIDEEKWKLVEKSKGQKTDKDQFEWTFSIYDKVR